MPSSSALEEDHGRHRVPPKRMFVVPGNHDVDRDVGRWLLRTLGKDERR
jgi:hypothetical protein